MDIQQILAATSSQASASKGAKEGAAGVLTGADFAKALASLSPAAGAEAVQGTPTEAAPQASLEALRRAVTALEDSGQAIPDELQALLSRADDSEALAQRLQALLSSAAGENTLPEGLQDLLSGASGVSLSQAHPAMDSGDETASPEMAAELQGVMQRLALIQGAGQPLSGNRGAPTATTLPASAAALAPSSLSLRDLATAQQGGQAAANAPATGTSNPLLQAAQARADAPAITAAALASAEATQQASGGQGNATATSTTSPQASPQALLEALAARREPQGGSGQGHPPPMAGPLGSSHQAASMTPPGNASAPATPQQATLSAPVDSPAWPRQLGQQLIRFGRGGGEQHIEMKLHPAELGPLSVTLKIGDQGAQAHFLSAHAQVRQTLEQALPQLREALAEQGIALGETSVGEQRQGDADGQSFAGTGGSSSGEDDETALAPQVSESARGRDIPLDGRVDLYA
ncbi:flagellar hook-length control protein FliK [Halomonas organivorans]|uniref:Flagellar hook-length control protein FliK n=1 Tax=Halomonas organivorans TaxID=257772 RepID=A0A7W5BY60_9GAMM|nr:flagellar hook-length control protein FliK [Halomonas organivorans]MBB3140368.1 flagellar hook-length control protein FliK [Halomonas organivorans]